MSDLLKTAVMSGVVKLLQSKAGLQNVKIHDARNSPYVINEGKPQDEPTPKNYSSLNTVVYSSVIFNKGKEVNGVIVISEWNDFYIDDCLISVSQSKKIVTTEVQGKDGTVKEYIGLGDYEINITGRINGSYNVNPKEETKKLKKILAVSQPLAITNWWLQNLDITDIVVKDFNFAQTEGEYSTQYFSVSAMSDFPIEALITGQ